MYIFEHIFYFVNMRVNFSLKVVLIFLHHHHDWNIYWSNHLHSKSTYWLFAIDFGRNFYISSTAIHSYLCRLLDVDPMFQMPADFQVSFACQIKWWFLVNFSFNLYDYARNTFDYLQIYDWIAKNYHIEIVIMCWNGCGWNIWRWLCWVRFFCFRNKLF